LPQLVSQIRAALPAAAIIVVDDSPDESTVRALDGLDVTLVHRAAKAGRGSAVLDGVRRMLAAPVEFVIEMDADFSHPPSELPALVDAARREQLDLLIASRYVSGSRIENWPLTRRLFSRAANRLARALLGIPVRDYTNGYRVYSRRAAQVIADRCGTAGAGFIALSEVLVTVEACGFRIAERKTTFVNRTRGESSVGPRELLGAATGLWKTARLQRRLRASKT